jgi:hypothetical protein
MVRVNDYQYAQFLKTCSVFSVDIETDTTPPSLDWTAKFGLSYVAPITHVSFYAPGYDPLVFTVFDTDFFREVFERSDYTVIAHNASFDLRSLGGHMNFNLPLGVRVWDTMVMSIRLLLAEPEKRGVKGKSEISLDQQIRKYCWHDIFYDTDSEFYNMMKAFRADFAAINATLRNDSENLLHQYVHLAPNTVDVNDEEYYRLATESIINHYVVMDTIFTYNLYEVQKKFIDLVQMRDTRLKDRHIPAWSNIHELVDWEQKISWVSARQAIVGLPLDQIYLAKKAREYAATLEDALQKVGEVPDTTDPYDGYLVDAAYLLWAEALLNCVRYNASYTSRTKFIFYNEHPHSDFLRLLELTLDWTNVEDKEAWLVWFGTFSTSDKLNKTKIIKSAPRGVAPHFDFEKWVTETSFGHVEEEALRNFLGYCKTTWLVVFFTQTEPMDAMDRFSKNIYHYYYLFCVCGIDLPSSEDIKFNPFLVTKKFATYLKEGVPQLSVRDFENDDDTFDEDNEDVIDAEDVDLRTLALTTRTLSAGKKAVDFYLPKPKLEDGETDNPEFINHPARWYRITVQMEAYLARINEFQLHAQRDGKIHPIISRVTRTGRFSSQTPNLQNLDMKVCKGYLYAPEGYWLLELDYANAENKTGAMVSGDDNFALATESGDFHSNQARIYFADEWKRAEEQDDRDTLARLRSIGKNVTFAGAYGAGALKIATMIRQTLEKAREILGNRERAYPKVALRKKEAGDKAQERLRSGFYPPFTPLWTGSRVSVPTFVENGEKGASGFKAWNYIQQGGVAEMISRAMVEATEWLLQNNYKSYIAFNVHDSLIFVVHQDEYYEVVPEVIRIMCHQMPEKYCKRTIPMVHFVTEVGPENSRKWGWRDSVPYPFPLDEFINQWGVHKLPAEELAKDPKKWEAPTWVGPKHLGWTLEKEMEEQRNARQS